MVSDPISDMLSRIRNAVAVNKNKTDIPFSKLKVEMARILKEEGYISDYSVDESGVQGTLSLDLKYVEGHRSAIVGMKRASRPGRRLYVNQSEIPKVQNGLGVAILSTSQGLLSGGEAGRRGIGGELLCEVW